MKKIIPHIKIVIPAVLIFLMFLVSCYRFTFVNQPYSAEINTSFEVGISVTSDHGIGAGYEWLYFGIMLPYGWTVEDSIIFTYETNIGRLVYSDSASQAMNMIDPAPLGYYWWCAGSTQETWWGSALNYQFMPVIHTDAQTGMYFLDYMVGDGNNGLNHKRSNDHLITMGSPDVVTVTTANDYCPGSLRDAIDRVDFYGTINFNLSPGDTIFLQEELRIYKDISIIGPQNSPVVISGNHTHRVLFIESNRNNHLANLHLVHGMCDAGGGLFCDIGSITSLKNVTIAHNNADMGGGLYFAGTSLDFDNNMRCNIFLNSAGWEANDIYSGTYLDVFLDTFTVLYPTAYYAHPLENFGFDILNAQIELIDADLYVSPEGNDSNSGLTADEPFKTIRHAFSLIMANNLHQNTIYLLEGTYSTSSNGEIFPIIMLDHISLTGVSEDSVILDAEGKSQVIKIENNSASNISGLTVTGGAEESGHAIHCASSLLEIHNLIIKNNLSGGLSNSGEGLCLSDVSITNNSINGDGAGMNIYEASPLLKNVVISNNIATGDGGGIECYESNPFLENVTISYNTAGGWGGGISGHNNNMVFDSFHRCNIYMNNASWGTDIHYHYSDSLLNVIVDTFTVMNPTAYHINPRDWCNFDILNSKIQQADADLYVSPDGDDENSGLTTDDPLKTIRYAMLKIRADNLHRNTIRLMEGTYGPSSTGLDFPMIIPDYYRISGSRASEVFIDAEYQSDVVIIDSDMDVFMSDLTITGGSEGGIQIWGNPTFENLIIASNNGSGIRHLRITGHANANLINVLIANNTSTGIVCSDSEMELTNVTIADNGGDGIYCFNGGSIDMRNSIISNNAGNAVGFLGYNPTSFVYSYYSNIDGYVDPWGNGSVYYLSGTIEENPIFVGSGNYPFALSQESPCVDAGDPDTAGMFLPLWDLAGNQRIWDGNGNDTAVIDMGAYEFGSMPVGISESRYQNSEIRIECFPNPTNGKSDIRYQISRLRSASDGQAEFRNVSLTVYDIIGKPVNILVNEAQTAGEYTVRFDATGLPAGLYIVRLQAGNERAVGKVLVVR